MTINAACCYLDDSKRWSKEFTGSADLGTSDNKHAERAAYDAAASKKSNATTFIIVQNAFPCIKCTMHFLGESKKGKKFIFHCESNVGHYAKECGFLSRPFVKDPDNPSYSEAQLNGFMYFKEGKITAKGKMFTIEGETSSDPKITSSRAVGGDLRPPELISLPDAKKG
ncbi:hypothetical protein ACMDCR_31810 [Labrys okinawensis]|uniref:hypothetical protein n=1 Tax=Labrys okinawensis TaxID=346911 RepID=UPI0039BD1412